MILVTLGTHERPMNRLFDELNSLAANGELSEQIILQSAALPSRHHPIIEVHAIVPFPVLQRWIELADVVVCHAGPGSILQALAQLRQPVVVPRNPKYGEHVDDHQLRFAKWLGSHRPIEIVYSPEDLLPAIERSRTAARPPERNSLPNVGVEQIARILSAKK